MVSIVIGAIVYGVTSLQADQYTATATLKLKSLGAAEALFASGAPKSAVELEREAATAESIVALPIVASRTAKQIGGITAAEVAGQVYVKKGDEFDLVSIRATSGDPHLSREVANTYAREFIAFRIAHNRAQLQEARELVEARFRELLGPERRRPKGRRLLNTVAKLKGLTQVQDGGAAVVSPASLPTSPSSPQPLRDGLIAAGLAFLFGGGAVLLLRPRRRSLRRPEDARDAFSLPIFEVGPTEPATSPWAAIEKRVQSGEIGSVLVTDARGDEGADALARDLVRAATDEHPDLAVVHAPPVGAHPETFPLLRQADAVITVCRLGQTSWSDAEQLRRELDRLGAPLIGCVVLPAKAEEDDSLADYHARANQETQNTSEGATP